MLLLSWFLDCALQKIQKFDNDEFSKPKFLKGGDDDLSDAEEYDKKQEKEVKKRALDDMVEKKRVDKGHRKPKKSKKQ